ncbi:MAG: bifunctional UDP-N-acetylglucosamine diphosphorylase/glucosamine-1-phosphate N-acetyltransferase GlmU [Candidatus Acidiferrales bacterium]|jgi:bifunctional UDP-N-acetylglucosamine pyrophosphorylase/glucosamine-1-phosphate N-acetyltransferase
MAGTDFVVVILAAGKGTRLKSSIAKVLHRAGGHTLIEHAARACQSLRAQKTIVVVGHQSDQVAAVLEPFGAETVLQQPQRGTGHAMLVARRAIGGRARFALVLPGDAPLVRSETLRALLESHRAGNAAGTILTALVENPSGYGRIVRRSGTAVAAVVEESQLTEEHRATNEINSGIYCFTLNALWPALAQVKPNNAHRELYLTDAIARMAGKGQTVLAQVAADAQEVLGCNTRAELAEADRVLRERKRAALMDAGVTIQLPETVLIDPDVIIGEDSAIEPCVQLLGKTKIGERCTIRTGSVLSDVTLGNDVTVEPHCVAASSRLDDAVVIGPFTRLRPGNHVKAGAHLGNFVEVKKSVIGEGTKAMHLSYLGDARIGAKSNIGAGTITCNYDGFHKYPTTIGKRSFIGSDSTLVAPVRVGDGAYVAAGSTITENVPADALGIARGRQTNKPGWAAAKRREMAAAEKKPAKSRRPKAKPKARSRNSRPRKRRR